MQFLNIVSGSRNRVMVSVCIHLFMHIFKKFYWMEMYKGKFAYLTEVEKRQKANMANKNRIFDLTVIM